jgi:hypothetical protein
VLIIFFSDLTAFDFVSLPFRPSSFAAEKGEPDASLNTHRGTGKRDRNCIIRKKEAREEDESREASERREKSSGNFQQFFHIFI